MSSLDSIYEGVVSKKKRRTRVGLSDSSSSVDEIELIKDIIGH